MAGGSLQCPKCSRLVSVPTLDDLNTLNPDGTYNLDVVAEPEHPAEKRRGSRDHMLPPDAATPRSMGVQEIPLEAIEPARVAPRYDPITGELIVPMKWPRWSSPRRPKRRPGPCRSVNSRNG